MSHVNNAQNDYFTWLIGLVDTPSRDLQSRYTRLLEAMDRVEYVYTYRKDLDRLIDAYDMRENWIFKDGPGVAATRMGLRGGKEVSFFEFLVTLCVNYSEKVLVYPGEPSVAPELFYNIMGNLNFYGCDNDNFDNFGTDFVVNMCQNVMNHVKNYVIFHVKNAEKMDFWQLMGVFCRENM